MSEPTPHQRVLCQIANCAFKVVSGWLDRDRAFARSLRSAQTTSRQIVREECITTDMVMTLKSEFPDYVDVTLFTPPEEARNGADWYWRIQKPNVAIHAQVQAKRIQWQEFGQDDAQGTVTIDEAQLDRMIKDVALEQAQLPGLQAWLATYAQYDATPPCGRPPSQCQSHGCGNTCAYRGLPSVWIAQANRFVPQPHGPNDKKVGVPIRRIVEDSLRLDCLLPCSSDAIGARPSAKDFQLFPNLPSYDSCVSIIKTDSALQAKFEGAIQIRV